jgi:elongator complex protein 3
MDKQKLKCRCIRCREVKNDISGAENAELSIYEYDASKGKEYFICFENKETDILYGFLRLRITKNIRTDIIPEIKDCALIRELHVYGPVLKVSGDTNYKSSQHFGFGRKLMAQAEKIALNNGYYKLAVISGVGVRNYYRKLGYELIGTYMIKTLSYIDYIYNFFN